MQRREEFYRSTGIRSGSSCSEDSVLDREKDVLIEREAEEMISKCLGDVNQYFSPDDSISLSLEYYQSHLDKTDVEKERRLAFLTCNRPKDTSSCNGLNSSSVSDNLENNGDKGKHNNKENSIEFSESNVKNNGQVICSEKYILNDVNKQNEHSKIKNNNETVKNDESLVKICDKRYLQCPAAVNMRHLQKFVRMKFGLTGDHRVDIIYKGEILPIDFSLMDVAYTFKWERKKPIRFFYRIFTPVRKISPIKIVTKASSTGGKQLQVVPLLNNSCTETIGDKVSERTERLSTEKISEKKEVKILPREETEKERQEKEKLFANLQLQSKTKAINSENKKLSIPNQRLIKDCIFEYEHQSQEEIKKFAEKRDREWALQKKLEEDNRDDYHVSKKRKKSKHSKNDSTSHKKRKIHAEITSNEKDDLKVKLKISSNGHKHKYHKISDSNDKSELSSKEKLLQLRQVRPKHLSQSGSGDEKSQPASLTIKIPKNEAKLQEKSKDMAKSETVTKKISIEKEVKTISRTFENINKVNLELKHKITTDQAKAKPIPPHQTTRPNFTQQNNFQLINRLETSNKSARKDFVSRPISSPFTAQKTFPKVSQVLLKSTDGQKLLASQPKLSTKPFSVNSIAANKSLDKRLSSIQQRCNLESKTPQSNTLQENKASPISEKPKIMTPQCPPGFTVSKVELGVKRKAEEIIEDKGKGLEIFLINPQKPLDIKPSSAKRPIPGVIPVKNTINLKSGVSITPKLVERKETSSPLDLSKVPRSNEVLSKAANKQEPPNGLGRQINNLVQRPMGSPSRNTPEVKNTNHQISNLHLLSKVAMEHCNKNAQSHLTSKPRPQIPNLQNIRLASMGQQTIRNPQNQRLPPKLNEIQKFRPLSPQIRSTRPPNQNIRNIPNPSLLINRQQQRLSNPVSSSTQNNANVMGSQVNISTKTEVTKIQTSNIVSTTSKDVKAVAPEQKRIEKNEISV